MAQPVESIHLESSVDDDSNKLENIVDQFFETIQYKKESLRETIDELGKAIVEKDSLLNYYSTDNAYEPGAFVFSAKDKGYFTIFTRHEFLKQSDYASTYKNYNTWETTLEDYNLVIISIEPHPIEQWLFIIRNKTSGW